MRIARPPSLLGAADAAGSETAETTSPPERDLAGAALTGKARKGAALTGYELLLAAAVAAEGAGGCEPEEVGNGVSADGKAAAADAEPLLPT